jgi:hypothetical protein
MFCLLAWAAMLNSGQSSGLNGTGTILPVAAPFGI